VTTNPELRRWPIRAGVAIQKEALEVKMYKDRTTEKKGLEQLGRYLTRLGEASGHLIIFDRRPKRSWAKKIFRRDRVALPPPDAHLSATVWGL
jgi:hypothetical protein